MRKILALCAVLAMYLLPQAAQAEQIVVNGNYSASSYYDAQSATDWQQLSGYIMTLPIEYDSRSQITISSLELAGEFPGTYTAEIYSAPKSFAAPDMRSRLRNVVSLGTKLCTFTLSTFSSTVTPFYTAQSQNPEGCTVNISSDTQYVVYISDPVLQSQGLTRFKLYGTPVVTPGSFDNLVATVYWYFGGLVIDNFTPHNTLELPYLKLNLVGCQTDCNSNVLFLPGIMGS